MVIIVLNKGILCTNLGLLEEIELEKDLDHMSHLGGYDFKFTVKAMHKN